MAHNINRDFLQIFSDYTMQMSPSFNAAKANKNKFLAYLRIMFEKLQTATSFDEYKALLPWNVKQKLLDLTD